MSDSEDYLKKKTCEPQTGALLLGKVYENSGSLRAHHSSLTESLRRRRRTRRRRFVRIQ
jgi:hypothetical protein